MPGARELEKAYQERVFGEKEYLKTQYLVRRSGDTWTSHKRRISDSDSLYRGDLAKRYPELDLPTVPLVENKYKNALHDISRLASEARPLPVFMRQGDSDAELKKARVREQIADTIWEMGDGPIIEDSLYMDILGTGMMALALYYNDKSDYAQFTRLDPRMCFPLFRNGVLQDMLYIETVSKQEAKALFPEMEFKQTGDKDVTIATLYDDIGVSSSVIETLGSGKTVSETHRLSTWIHGLGCVPVAFTKLPSYDGALRGLFDQLGGPMAIRNKIVAYLDDYLEGMVHAPFEAKNVLNSDEDPGPGVIYQHDPNADESFMRRVAPATPSSSIWTTLGYMDDQESKEAIQPPSRVGSVSQSIASGSFVASTQGGLSSAVKAVQKLMAAFRNRVHYIAFKIEEKHLDHEKPLLRAIGKKAMYTPSKDIAGKYKHRILFGAAAGLDRQYADVRVLQFLGAQLISKETARAQIDFLDDASTEQDQIDLEQTGTVLFQRLMADPATPVSVVAQLLMVQAEGGGLMKALKEVAPDLVAAEARAQQAAAGGPLAGAPEGAISPEEAALALEKGGAPIEGGAAIQPISPFAPPPLQQQIVNTGR